MGYTIRSVNGVEEELSRIHKRDKALYEQLIKKLERVAENPYASGKWMHGPYVGIRELHLMHGRFVVMFRIDDKEGVVSIVNLEHHPERY